MAKTKAMIIIKIDVRAGGAWVFSIDAEEQDTEVTVVGGAVVTVDVFFQLRERCLSFDDL